MPLSKIFQLFEKPPLAAGLVVLVLIALVMIRWPLAKAGSPDEPAPPTAMM
jgi:hypothetical protein